MPTEPSGLTSEHSLLLHIGPRKTGTTAIQQALATRRDELRAHGVIYPGRSQQHFRAVNRLIGRRQLWEEDHEAPVVEETWRTLVEEIGNAPRGVISTEILSQARENDVRRVVGSFAGRTVTVVITYRPFEMLLSSTWQQLVKEGLRDPLDEWSRRAVIDHPEESHAPFPRVLDVATLVDIWGGVVGLENVVVALVDRARPLTIFNAFEELLGLPDGFLVPTDVESRKRSLTAQEAELLRQTNLLLPRDSVTLKQQRYLRRLASKWVDEHPPCSSDTPLVLPADVIEQARVRSGAMVESLRSVAGRVRVYGDLESLVASRDSAAADPGTPTNVDVALAAEWLAGIIASLPSPEDE